MWKEIEKRRGELIIARNTIRRLEEQLGETLTAKEQLVQQQEMMQVQQISKMITLVKITILIIRY